MIRLVLFDLGGTLVRDGELFPHVVAAIEATAQFETEDGEPLVSCLLSDYYLAEPVDDADAIEARFQEYLSVLENLCLREWFEPVDERVTLSTHAGALKPDRNLFELAVARTQIEATLEECLFITEDHGHIEAARALGITTLTFDPDPESDVDFHDWSEGPLRIRSLVSPESEVGLAAALSVRLSATEDLEITTVSAGPKPEQLCGRGRIWVALQDPELGPLDGAYVQVPVSASVFVRPDGGVVGVERGEPDPDAVAEVRQFVRGLMLRGQVAIHPDTVGPGQTHEITIDEKGRRRLTRKRF